MKLLSLNCQEFGNPWTIQGLCDIVEAQAPKVCFLMETKLFVDGFTQICKDTKLPNNFVVKKPSWGGRLAMRYGKMMLILKLSTFRIITFWLRWLRKTVGFGF